MGQIKWYKRDPDAALSGMMGLSLEERGAYNTVLDLIYTRDGNLPDDDRFVSGWLGVDVRVWRRIKTRLLALEKLYVEDGILGNRRADVEVDAALSRVGSAREAGLASADSKRRKSNGKRHKNNDVASTAVETKGQQAFQLTTTTTRDIEIADAISRPTSPSGEAGPEGKNGHSVSDDQLRPEHVVETWNQTAEAIGKPRVRDLTPERRQLVRARIAQYSIEDFVTVFGKIRASPFLRGDTGKHFCTFDWAMKKSNFQKIIEGNYDHG